MQSIVITGSGQLASALEDYFKALGQSPVVLSRDECDVRQASVVKKKITQAKPDIVFHTAALTRVNYCEENPKEAMAINRDGTENVLKAVAECNARIVYFSTDYVFDGSKDDPWVENDQPNPLNVYGSSKLAGEEIVRSYKYGHIVRTSGVFGPRNDDRRKERNFFRAVATRLLATNDEVPVVSDQITAVSFAPHLAEMTVLMLKSDLPRVLHITSFGNNSWYEWARTVCDLLDVDNSRITSFASDELPPTPKRPLFSVLGTSNNALATLMTEYLSHKGIGQYLASLITKT